MLTTQLSYIPVAATMLSTTFFEPSVEYCNSMNHTTGIINSKVRLSLLRLHFFLVI